MRRHGWDCEAKMNIILVSGRLAKARTLTLTLPHLAIGTVLVLLVMLFVAFSLQYFMLHYATSVNSSFVNTLIMSAQQEHNEKTQTYLRDNLSAMASKLGQMQAQLL